MTKKTMKLNFDREFDVLYIKIADKSNSYGDEVEDGFVVMKDFITKRITGFTIFDFKERYLNKTLDKLPLPFPINFEKDVISKIDLYQ